MKKTIFILFFNCFKIEDLAILTFFKKNNKLKFIIILIITFQQKNFPILHLGILAKYDNKKNYIQLNYFLDNTYCGLQIILFLQFIL